MTGAVLRLSLQEGAVLARSLRQRDDGSPAPIAAATAVGYSFPELPPQSATYNPGRKRRQNSVRICRLYPEPPTEAEIHARAVLALVQEHCPDHIGGYVPRFDLETCYREFCAQEGWRARHWTAIARELGKLTAKKELRQRGQRFIAYRIPKERIGTRIGTG
jgi:hypothetical protein